MKRFDKTFYQYQLDYKPGQAYALIMKGTDLKIQEIALDLGFCDGSYLSKLFKKYGASPSQYRKEHLR